MARYTGPACRLCRREGVKLFLKGDKCKSGKCALTRRSKSPLPGQHGAAKKQLREYGMQLREKQKAKRYYGVPEKQFKKYFVAADKKAGVTGDNLLALLERRLDNVVYSMGLASSRKEARQLVTHGHFTVNGKKATIPSIIVRQGDVIALKEKSKESPKFKELMEAMQDVTIPQWLSVDKENAKATVIALPTRADVEFPFEEHLIVELYSK